MPALSQRDDWRLLLSASAALTASLDLEEVLCRVLPLAAEVAGAQGCSVILLDPNGDQLEIAAASGPKSEQLLGMRFPRSAGIAGRVLEERKPRIVGDAQDERAHLKEVDQSTGLRTRSLMAAPLVIGEERLGVVEVVNRIAGGPFRPEDLERFAVFCNLIAVALKNARTFGRIHRENEGLRRTRDDQRPAVIADSTAMRRLLSQADRAAESTATVLLLGETGTGKEMLANRIHQGSPRSGGPFVTLNCGALPENLVESELFGHERGAFTGAERRRLGRFELADGGTLFLDEIAELPPAAQVKLLRVLQEGELNRVGGEQPVRVDVRLLAATHRDLEAEVAAGRFRQDLFYRVHVLPLKLPPLRERREDIVPLLLHFLAHHARRLGRPPRSLPAEAVERLWAHPWPGNVRELQNVAERLTVLGEEGPVSRRELDEVLPRPEGPPAANRPAAGESGELSLWELERRLVSEALEESGGNQSVAARRLGISRSQLRTRMQRYHLLSD